jgi:hypothetical protein
MLVFQGNLLPSSALLPNGSDGTILLILSASCTPHLVVPWLGQVAAGFSLHRPSFMSRSVHVGFAVDKVVLGQVSLSSSVSPCWYHSIVTPYSWTIGPLVATVQRHSLTPPAWTTTLSTSSLKMMAVYFSKTLGHAGRILHGATTYNCLQLFLKIYVNL